MAKYIAWFVDKKGEKHEFACDTATECKAVCARGKPSGCGPIEAPPKRNPAKDESRPYVCVDDNGAVHSRWHIREDAATACRDVEDWHDPSRITGKLRVLTIPVYMRRYGVRPRIDGLPPMERNPRSKFYSWHYHNNRLYYGVHDSKKQAVGAASQGYAGGVQTTPITTNRLQELYRDVSEAMAHDTAHLAYKDGKGPRGERLRQECLAEDKVSNPGGKKQRQQGTRDYPEYTGWSSDDAAAHAVTLREHTKLLEGHARRWGLQPIERSSETPTRRLHKATLVKAKKLRAHETSQDLGFGAHVLHEEALKNPADVILGAVVRVWDGNRYVVGIIATKHRDGKVTVRIKRPGREDRLVKVPTAKLIALTH